MPPSPHVLLMDDHAEVRALLAYVLTQVFLEVTIAQEWHGAEACVPRSGITPT
jgi:CheY-like chemotaxis protein